MTTATLHPDNHALPKDELIARGWASLPASYRMPDVPPHLKKRVRGADAWQSRTTRIFTLQHGSSQKHCVHIFMPSTLTAECLTILAMRWEIRGWPWRSSICGARNLMPAMKARHGTLYLLRWLKPFVTVRFPKEPFADLLTAFRQDQTVIRYSTMHQVLEYCRYRLIQWAGWCSMPADTPTRSDSNCRMLPAPRCNWPISGRM